MIRSLLISTALVLMPLAAHAAEAMRGVALVIGESKYDELPVLTNPSKDARDIDRLLGDLGFDVDRVLNADGGELREAIARFEDEAKNADVALIYYSGHGIEAKGQNFIAPTDTDLSSPETAGASMVAVQPILDELAKVVPVSIVLLDACRSDPFPAGQMIVLPGDTAPTPVEGQGLAAVRGPTPVAVKKDVDPSGLGSVIGFSASPGEPALDGAPGENSPYAAALIKHFSAGGYSFGDVMTMVSEEVYLKTKAQQLPWTNSSLRSVLTFDAPAEDDGDADQDAIKTERRKLLLTIASTPVQTQKYVEQLAGQEQVPLDALYGMLNVLGVKATDGGDLEQQLQKGATKLKELIAEKPTAVKADPELERLSKLADDAEAEGAIALALKYRDQATGRADTLLQDKQDEAKKLQQDMLDIAATYAQNAATALLNFDHAHAAELYGKAFDAVKDWDKSQAFNYKIGQGDALYDVGYYAGTNEPLTTSLDIYKAALDLAPRELNPANWSEVQDRIGQALQTLGERAADGQMLQTSLASYRAALDVRTQAAMPTQWATTQNNLGNVLYTIGKRQRDTAMMNQAVVAMEAALQVFTPETAPAKWSTTESNLASVRIDIATLIYASSDSAEMTAYAAGNKDATNIPEVVKARTEANAVLDQALSALQNAIDVRGAQIDPLDLAQLQHALASGYAQRGEMNHSVPDLKKASDEFRVVLRTYTRDRTPAQWVTSSNNLAITLKKTTDETSDPTTLHEAVAIYRDVVAATSREAQPLDWADYQENLGNALAALGDYDTDPVPDLDAALEAYKAAGEVTTLDRGVPKWQGLQTAIATTLLMKGIKAYDKASVLEAQRITLAARDKLRELGQPDDVFYEQYLGAADKVLGLFPK